FDDRPTAASLAAVLASRATTPASHATSPAEATPVATGAGVSLTAAQRAHIDTLATALRRRSPTSKQLAGAYRRRLAEARPWVNFRPELKELTVPLTVERAAGCRLWDVDGAEYVDFCMGFGVHLFGHAPEFVTEAVRRQLE